tara:strand:+ start:1458 stop:2648 length:1191 start_codon:yes stop_codon:yes gene_type:complete
MNNLSYLLALESRGIKMGLNRTKKLLDSCKNPEQNLKCIQIAGTNGKGSVASMLSNILIGLGLKVGLYTSPHLVSINERIRINGHPIKNKDLNYIIKKYKKSIEINKASFFEAMTLIAFSYFQIKKTDIAILETGLGGRYDSVTACNPELVVFTPISIDHKEILGDTIEKIALEKSGIIKFQTPIFSSKQKQSVRNILIKKAKEKECHINFCNYENHIKLKYLYGQHQNENAQLAYDVAKFLHSNKKDIILKKLKKTKWPGRYQVIKKNPYIIFDVGHNEEGINVFLNQYEKENIIGKKYIIIVLQKRKSIINQAKRIENFFDLVICSETENKYSMDASVLNENFSKSKSIIIKNVEKAIKTINKKLDLNDSLVIIGSHYLGNSIQRVYKKSFDSL